MEQKTNQCFRFLTDSFQSFLSKQACDGVPPPDFYALQSVRSVSGKVRRHLPASLLVLSQISSADRHVPEVIFLYAAKE